MNIQSLYKEKRELWYQAEDLLKTAEAENRELTTDQLTQYNKILDSMNSKQANIDAMKKADELRSENRETIVDEKKPITVEETRKIKSDAVNKWLRGGTQSLGVEDRKILNLTVEGGSPAIDLRADPASQTVTTTGGGYTIDTELASWIETAKKWYGPMLMPGETFTTSKGGTIYWPTIDDTSNTGVRETINTNMFDDSTGITFGRFQLDAYKYSSEGILVPFELLQDSEFNIAKVVGEVLGERLYRAVNTAMTTGDGSGDPNGVVTAAYIGENAASGALTRTDLVRLIHSVDKSYRESPKAAFMMHDSTLRYIRLLTIGSNDDRSLWQPSMVSGEPDRIEGYKYWINNDMDELGANKKSVLFGDFGKYLIRQVPPLRVVRLNERYAEQDSVGFIVLARYDGDLLKANTTTSCPIKYLRNLGT